MGREVIFEVEDQDGSIVRLYAAQWKHIQKHKEMSDQLEAIKLTISDPDAVTQSDTMPLDPSGERRVASRMGTHSRYPRMYVRVPIEYAQAGNWVTTAYVNPLPAKGDLIYVRIAPRTA